MTPVHPLIRYAFYVFVFSIPLEYPDRTIPVEVHTITGALLILTALLQPRECFRRPHAAFLWLAVFLWLYVSRGLFSEHVADAAKLLGNFALVACVFWVAQNLMRQSRVTRSALVAFALGCAVVAGLQLLNVATTTEVDSEGSIRVTVFDQDANLLGANMTMALVVVIGLAQQALRLKTWRHSRAAAIAVATAPMLLFAHAVLRSGSRGAVLAAVAGLLMLPLRPGRAPRVVGRAIVGGLTAAVIGWLAITAGPLAHRFANAEGGNLAGREHLYPEAWAMFLDRPVLGWGPVDNTYELGMRTASFAIGGEKDQRERKDPHNLLLDLLTATGVVGAVPLLMCLALCVGMAWRGRASPYGTLPLALLAASLVISLDVNWLATKQLWLACAYAVASGRWVDARRRVVVAARAAGGRRASPLRGVAVPDLFGNVHRA